MRFKEEVLAKVFTYITVVLLLGIVIFEAWTVQNERSRRKEVEETIASVQDSLQKTIDMNASLQEKNEDLEAFQKEWGAYAAFVESKEILSLKTDLFVRPDLIPQEAVDALEEKNEAGCRAGWFKGKIEDEEKKWKRRALTGKRKNI